MKGPQNVDTMLSQTNEEDIIVYINICLIYFIKKYISL